MAKIGDNGDLLHLSTLPIGWMCGLGLCGIIPNRTKLEWINCRKFENLVELNLNGYAGGELVRLSSLNAAQRIVIAYVHAEEKDWLIGITTR